MSHSKKDMSNPMLDEIVKKAAELVPAGSQIALFGSRARGDMHEGSDWDIHILIPGEEHLPLSEISRIAQPLEEIGWDYDENVNVLVYSYKGWKKRYFLPFYKNVEADKIILLTT